MVKSTKGIYKILSSTVIILVITTNILTFNSDKGDKPPIKHDSIEHLG